MPAAKPTPAPKRKTTAARLCECIRAAQEAGQTVASARVEVS